MVIESKLKAVNLLRMALTKLILCAGLGFIWFTLESVRILQQKFLGGWRKCLTMRGCERALKELKLCILDKKDD